MMKKIIIFTISPINKDFLKRYGYEFFQRNNIEVMFFNVCNLIYGIKKTQRLGYDNLGKINDVNELEVLSYNQLYFLLKSYREGSIIYFNISESFRLLFILFLVKLPYIDGSLWGGIQTKDWDKKNILLSLYTKICSVLKSPRKKIQGKISFYSLGILRYYYPPQLTLTSNPNELISYKTNNIDKRILLNHTFDYDRFLINKDMNKPSYIPDYDYHVLLPNHAWMIHDYIINDADVDCVITKERYEKLINKTLDDIELSTGIKIIVAGYPVASKNEDIYRGREFLLGTETEQLVKYSSGVITHFSGAINFAVIHSKPICIINYKIFDDDPRFFQPINAYSKSLNIPINYVDSNDQVNSLVSNGLFSLNKDSYQDYLNKFICPEEILLEKPQLFWERVLQKF